MAHDDTTPLVRVEGLRTYFDTEGQRAWAVDGVSFDIRPNEMLGIVGESGCGKSVTALSIMRLIPDPPGRIAEGKVLFEGRDLLAIDYPEMRKIRGRDIAMKVLRHRARPCYHEARFEESGCRLVDGRLEERL